MLSLPKIRNIYCIYSNRISTRGYGAMGQNIYTNIVCPYTVMCERFKGQSELVTNDFW